jgi:hypothetical protein
MLPFRISCEFGLIFSWQSDEVGSMCSRDLPQDAHPRASLGSDVLHTRISYRFDSLVLWVGLVILRIGLDRAIQEFSIQYWMVGLYIPAGGLCV